MEFMYAKNAWKKYSGEKLQELMNFNEGYKHFITGMALGSDMICAEIILELKKKHSNIELECAIPCTNQTEKWFGESLKRYQKNMQRKKVRSF